jgi:3-oxoacyl-[acyl-carrier protein] reductase
MSQFLMGKKAIVTGSSKGIGLEVARSLLREGCEVLICGRNQTALDKAAADLQKSAAGGNVWAFAADVSVNKQVEELFAYADKQFGSVEILINNAGTGRFHATGEMSIEDWDLVIGTNLSGAFYCSRAAIERFQRNRSGWIVNISSLAGRNPFAGGAAYNASKFGLNGFSEAMMLDHRNDNIRVSYIMPGSVDTAFAGQEGQAKSDWKIAPDDIGEIVLGILRMPARTLISRVEVRPSRPQKY